jgi:hypothetical protein
MGIVCCSAHISDVTLLGVILHPEICERSKQTNKQTNKTIMSLPSISYEYVDSFLLLLSELLTTLAAFIPTKGELM